MGDHTYFCESCGQALPKEQRILFDGRKCPDCVNNRNKSLEEMFRCSETPLGTRNILRVDRYYEGIQAHIRVRDYRDVWVVILKTDADVDPGDLGDWLKDPSEELGARDFCYSLLELDEVVISIEDYEV